MDEFYIIMSWVSWQFDSIMLCPLPIGNRSEVKLLWEENLVKQLFRGHHQETFINMENAEEHLAAEVEKNSLVMIFCTLFGT